MQKWPLSDIQSVFISNNKALFNITHTHTLAMDVFATKSPILLPYFLSD